MCWRVVAFSIHITSYSNFSINNKMQKLPQNDRLVRVNADSSSKRFIIVTFLTSFTIFLAMFLIAGLAVPEMLAWYPATEAVCPADASAFKGFCTDLNLSTSNKWQAEITNLTPQHAFLSIGATAMRARTGQLGGKFIRS